VPSRVQSSARDRDEQAGYGTAIPLDQLANYLPLPFKLGVDN